MGIIGIIDTLGVSASLIVLIIGSIYGAVSGLLGGKSDSVMMRIVEIIYSLPDILIIILLQLMLKPILEEKSASGSGGVLQVLGPGIIAIFVVFGLLYWVGMARIVRAQVLSLKEMEYINTSVTYAFFQSLVLPIERMPTRFFLPLTWAVATFATLTLKSFFTAALI